MAVELDVKIERQASLFEIVARANERAARCFRGGLGIRSEPRIVDDIGLGDRDESVAIYTDHPDAMVSVSVFRALGAAFGEEQGTWVSVSAAVLRTDEAFVLMILFAAAISEVAGGIIHDESGLLGRGRLLSVETLDRVLRDLGRGQAFDAAVASIQSGLHRGTDQSKTHQ